MPTYKTNYDLPVFAQAQDQTSWLNEYILVGVLEDCEIEVEYTYSPSRPPTGPTYSCGGEPAEQADVEFLDIKFKAKDGQFHSIPAGQTFDEISQWLDDNHFDD